MASCGVIVAVWAALGGGWTLQAAEAPGTGEPIKIAAVEASSVETGSKKPENLIDGSGLSDDGTAHSANPYRHKGLERGTMWCSAYHKDRQPVLTFDLGQVRSVGSARVWNCNEGKGYAARGAKVLEISSSPEGKDYQARGSVRLERGPGEDGYEGQALSFDKAFEARFIRFRCVSNYGGDITGLSEVRFFAGGAGAAGAISPASVLPPEKKPGYPPKPAPNPPRPAVAGAENIVFPADSGIVDVTAAPYNAKGDGQSDDTKAIQQAIDDYPSAHAIIYLPNGTYVISNTLRWSPGWRGGMEQKNIVLQGQSAAGTVLKLKDNCPGFGDAEKPKAMIWTGSAPAQRFGNAVRNLTLDSGSGNRGAVGAQFMANNQGCVRDVVIRCGPGGGAIGLDMGYSNENGPLLVKNLRVAGFDVGIRCRHGINSQTLENITLEGQALCGLDNDSQILSIRGLTSRNKGPAVRSHKPAAMLTLLEARLEGEGESAGAGAAIELSGTAYLRDIRTRGYARAVQAAGTPVPAPPGAEVEEWVSHPALGLEEGKAPPARSLRLAIKDTPDVPWDAVSEWASPLAFGGRPDDKDDDSEAIQKAIDSGKPTVYLPNGRWTVRKTVFLRGAVRRLIGCQAYVDVPQMDQPAFQVVEGTAPVVVIERLHSGYARTVFLSNVSPRTVVVNSCINVCGAMAGSGEVFIEDVCANPFTSWTFKGQKVWARQLNVENEGTHVVNEGGSLWVLGYKTERGGTLICTRGGGRTELLGGMSYTTTQGRLGPMFVVEDSAMSAVFGETFFNFKDSPYTVLVEETREGRTRRLNKGQAPGRLNGSQLPLMVCE